MWFHLYQVLGRSDPRNRSGKAVSGGGADRLERVLETFCLGFFLIYLIIYSAVLGLSCGMWDPVP